MYAVVFNSLNLSIYKKNPKAWARHTEVREENKVHFPDVPVTRTLVQDIKGPEDTPSSCTALDLHLLPFCMGRSSLLW